MTFAQPQCDRGLGLAGPGRPRRHPGLIGVVTILASSLAFIDGSVVNVGLPAIGRDFAASAADLQWVINAYLLPLSALLLLGGALGDRYGAGRVLVWGVLLFAGGSAGCALSSHLSQLLAARAGQGVGAALLLPASLAVLGSSFEGAARTRMVGLWAACSAIMAAIGPVLGGWLIDRVGWPAIFVINLPLAALVVGIALYALRGRRAPEKKPRLDVLGAALATGALGLLTWGLTVGAGPDGWSAGAAVATAAGIVLMLAYLWAERRAGEDAMTPLALFGSGRLVGLNLATFLLYGALAGFMLLLPFRLIEAGGWPATAAGAALLPFPLVMSVLSPVMGDLAGRAGVRPLLLAGSVVVAGGCLLGLRISAAGGYWVSTAPSVVVFALGMSCAAAPLTSAVLGSVDERHTGVASGLNSAVARTGGLIATALLGRVLAARGPELEGAFRIAMAAAAAAALLAGLVVFALVRPTEEAFLKRKTPAEGDGRRAS
jgi:EmrB/QacA subfamily drug resistance transporter